MNFKSFVNNRDFREIEQICLLFRIIQKFYIEKIFDVFIEVLITSFCHHRSDYIERKVFGIWDYNC